MNNYVEILILKTENSFQSYVDFEKGLLELFPTNNFLEIPKVDCCKEQILTIAENV